MRSFACIKAKIGDWDYYITTMRLGELIKYVSFAEQIFPRADLDQVMQRELTKRSADIAHYLLNNEQRFLGALIVAAVGGEPKFAPLSFGEESFYEFAEGKLGFLRFDGTESYYVLDGQHRLAAIKDALSRDEGKLAKDEVSLILISHKNDEEGRKRARRLFTTVNRYAKKTSKTDDLTFDEDSPADIYTRRLVREHEFFKERTKVTNLARQGEFKITQSEALKPEEKYDHNFLLAVLTLKRCNHILLDECFLKPRTQSQVLPDFETLEAGYAMLVERWKLLVENVEPWKFLRDNPQSNLDQVRRKDGGHVLARPIAIVAFVSAATRLFDSNGPQANIAKVVNYFQDLAQAPWRGLLWKDEGGMHDGQARRKAAEIIFSYYLTGDPGKEEAAKQWRSATGREIPSSLPDRDTVLA